MAARQRPARPPWLAPLLMLVGPSLIVAAAFAVYLATIAAGAFDIDRAALEARYALPGGRFETVGPTDYYVVAQGEGPPVVLVSPPYLSLHAYDDFAAALARHYRVIRFDLPANGLTRMAAERGYTYDSIADDMPVLMDRLGVPRAAVLGSSSGAAVAYHFAARHADRLSRLVLISPSGMPRTATTDPNRPQGSALHRWIIHRYRSRAFWRDEALGHDFTSGVQPSEALVQTAYDTNRLRGRTRAYYTQRLSYNPGRPDEILAKVRAPTLILWGAANPTFSPLEAEVLELWLTNAPSLIIKYPRLGLYPWLEAPGAVERDVMAFLSGADDDRLRRTLRVPVSAARAENAPT